MNTYDQVTAMISSWQAMGMTKAERCVLIAEACMGWPYVWGGYGQKCTKANREAYANRGTCPSGEADEIRKKCQRLRESNPKDTCTGCKWYPGSCTLFFDCRGFTRWVLARIGISLQGAGATSQWNTAANWEQKGAIKDMPTDRICCVFMQNGSTMSHTGLYVGYGRIIHCSGEVKEGKTTDRGWTHYAIPKGIEGEIPVPTPTPTYPTLRKGSKGEYVTLLQTKLIQKGYDLQPFGADGSYGNKTVAAVKQFQKDVGLTADGVTGPKTWNAILNGETVYYTVMIKHLGKKVAEDIVKQYGGTMTAEGV